MNVKSAVKKIIPKELLNIRHYFYAWLGSVVYCKPSEKLLVIGVTGTSGKSSTVYMLRQMLEKAGFKVGALSTIEFYIKGTSKLNDKKMTMLGKMAIQKYLRQMVDEGCNVAIVETTSEGAVQYRHMFINYDMIMLTNLYPEHIESHGSFENYKKAKLDIFDYVSRCKVKNIKINENLILDNKFGKVCFVNNESEYKQEFLSKNFTRKVLFGKGSELTPNNISVNETGLHFSIGGQKLDAKMFGEYNVLNISAAAAIAQTLNVDWSKITDAISQFHGVPGRIEFIPEATKYNFKVIVDYAFEPVAMAELYKVVDLLKPNRVIHVFGSTGGGRDKERRFTVGKYVGERADICIVTDEDPYDDNPMDIINDVAKAVEQTGKKENIDLFKILDRKEGIKKALDLAQNGDLILITGKGSEQAMVIKGQLVPWDDRKVVRDFLSLKVNAK